MRRRVHVPAPAQARQGREERAMSRNHPVTPLAGVRKDRRVFIPVEQPTLMGIHGKRAEDSLRAAIDTAIRLDQLHCRLELAARHLGKARCHGGILIRKIVQAIARRMPPAVNPQRAEFAVAVIDHHRLRRGRGDPDKGSHPPN